MFHALISTEILRSAIGHITDANVNILRFSDRYIPCLTFCPVCQCSIEFCRCHKVQRSNKIEPLRLPPVHTPAPNWTHLRDVFLLLHQINIRRMDTIYCIAIAFVNSPHVSFHLTINWTHGLATLWVCVLCVSAEFFDSPQRQRESKWKKLQSQRRHEVDTFVCKKQ